MNKCLRQMVIDVQTLFFAVGRFLLDLSHPKVSFNESFIGINFHITSLNLLNLKV